MNELSALGYLIVAPFALCFLGGVVSWFFAAYYMIKLMRRFRPERKWGKFLPFSLFSPWFFTEEGNYYRVKLLKASGLFLLCISLMVLGGKAVTYL